MKIKIKIKKKKSLTHGLIDDSTQKFSPTIIRKTKIFSLINLGLVHI